MNRYPFEVPDLQGLALSVAGPVDVGTLGMTSMHEHIFVDLRRPPHARRPGEDAPAAFDPLGPATVARVRHGAPNADNDAMGDFDELLPEVMAFTHAGGGTIVEVSNVSIGRNPQALKRMSDATGLTIVMGAGWYTPTFHPLDMGERSVDELTEAIVRDVVLGADGSGIRSGIIGEVGAETDPLTENEWASVRASARASRITGAPISLHVGGVGDEKLRVIDAIRAEGVEPGNIVMGHSNSLLSDPGLLRRVLATGVFVEFDYLAPVGGPWGALYIPGDHKVVQGLVRLVDESGADQVLLAHDVCQKIQLKKFGGKGYDYIPRHFLPALRDAGADEAAIHAIMVDNPARALAFDAPQGLV